MCEEDPKPRNKNKRDRAEILSHTSLSRISVVNIIEITSDQRQDLGYKRKLANPDSTLLEYVKYDIEVWGGGGGSMHPSPKRFAGTEGKGFD